MQDDTVCLRHILEAIRRVEENTAGGHDAFMASHTLQDAVLRNLQTMAEEAKAAQPSIAWRALSGFRNVLVHNYLGIDLEQIWIVVRRDVPPLKAAAASLLTRSQA